MTYTFLDHTADIKFLARGETAEEALVESVKALKESICGDIPILEKEEIKISIAGTSKETLLYNFLEEFIVLLDSKEFLISTIKNIKVNLENNTIEATLLGDKIDNYRFTNDVKAVTYSEMIFQYDEQKNLWEIQVVLDV